MDTIGSRLKLARAQAGHANASAAARAFGFPVSTYLGHENGDLVPSRAAAKRYADERRQQAGVQKAVDNSEIGRAHV